MDLNLKLASKEINEIMWLSHKTLSSAESCTAGRISEIITAAPGSSSYYVGGVTAYMEHTKTNLLGVDSKVLEEKTPVCEEVVRQMVIGANKLFGSDYSIAISGYAGPGGAPNGSVLVGTIWIAVGANDNIVTKMLEGDEGRDQNLANATNAAIHMLLEFLRENCPKENA